MPPGGDGKDYQLPAAWNCQPVMSDTFSLSTGSVQMFLLPFYLLLYSPTPADTRQTYGLMDTCRLLITWILTGGLTLSDEIRHMAFVSCF